MCPRRLLINRSPRYLLMWQCRRLTTVSTSHLWMPPYRGTHKVPRLSTSLHRLVLAQLPRFLLILFVQTPIRSVVLHDVAIQLPITEFFTGCIFSNDPLNRQNFVRQSTPSVQDDIGSVSPLWFALSPGPILIATISSALWPHVHCFSHRGTRTVCPAFGSRYWFSTCTLHMAYLLKRHLYHPGYVQLSQSCLRSLLFVPPKWEHILCAQLLPPREVLVPPLVGTHNPVGADPRTGTGPFPKPRALVLHLGQIWAIQI